MTDRADCIVLRLPALRVRFRKREWETLRRLRVVVGIHVVHLEVVVVDAPSCHGGKRRWLRCPNAAAGCSRLTCVVALDPTTGVVGCRVCMVLRTRSAVPAPHTRESPEAERNER